MWISGHRETDGYVDITDNMDRKIEALLCHRSQHPDPEAMTRRVRDWCGAVADHAQFPPGRCAEAFYVVDTR